MAEIRSTDTTINGRLKMGLKSEINRLYENEILTPDDKMNTIKLIGKLIRNVGKKGSDRYVAWD